MEVMPGDNTSMTVELIAPIALQPPHRIPGSAECALVRVMLTKFIGSDLPARVPITVEIHGAEWQLPRMWIAMHYIFLPLTKILK